MDHLRERGEASVGGHATAKEQGLERTAILLMREFAIRHVEPQFPCVMDVAKRVDEPESRARIDMAADEPGRRNPVHPHISTRHPHPSVQLRRTEVGTGTMRPNFGMAGCGGGQRVQLCAAASSGDGIKKVVSLNSLETATHARDIPGVGLPCEQIIRIAHPRRYRFLPRGIELYPQRGVTAADRLRIEEEGLTAGGPHVGGDPFEEGEMVLACRQRVDTAMN